MHYINNFIYVPSEALDKKKQLLQSLLNSASARDMTQASA